MRLDEIKSIAERKNAVKTFYNKMVEYCRQLISSDPEPETPQYHFAMFMIDEIMKYEKAIKKDNATG